MLIMKVKVEVRMKTKTQEVKSDCFESESGSGCESERV